MKQKFEFYNVIRIHISNTQSSISKLEIQICTSSILEEFWVLKVYLYQKVSAKV